MECTCQKDFFDSSSGSSCINNTCSSTGKSYYLSIPDNSSYVENVCTLDFGEVPVGTESSMLLLVKNDSGEDKILRFKRDPHTNPIYYCFDLDVYEKKVAANGSYELTVTYLCTIPYQKNRDHFSIYANGQLIHNIVAKADSIGPSIEASSRWIFFYKCPKGYKTKNILELRNMSDAEAIFHFDVNDNQQDVFVVKPVRGTIEAQKNIYIEVVYVPKKPGQHYASLPCLIHYHETIIIEAAGIYSINEHMDPSQLTFTHYFLHAAETSGFSGYLSDSLKIRTTVPPVSLSENVLDFGRVLPTDAYNKTCTVCNCLTLVTSLTNHTDRQLEIIWEKDCDNVFKITPERITLPRKEAVLFECNFYPNFADQYYFKILTAQIVWARHLNESPNSELFVSLLTSLRLIGHSFPENTGWIPCVEAPTNVILPATLPTFATHNTFLLRAKGPLPVLFKFLAPKDSFFIVKPMAGIIRNYQIVVVQMQTVASKNLGRIEQWLLELNGQDKRRLQVYFKAQAEFPSVIIGNSNFIKFDYINPGCQGIVRESFRNQVSYPIRYDFALEAHPYLTLSVPSGVLQSNEVVSLNWFFLASITGPRKVIVKCELHAMQKLTETIGPPFETFVFITSECSHSHLCAIPKTYDFGSLRFGYEESTVFTMFNFGMSPLHVTLKYTIPEELKGSMIEIKPLRATIAYREKCTIKIRLRACNIGSYRIKIFYYLRLNENSDQLADNAEGIEIFSFNFVCTWPTVQITQILEHNFGPLFSNANLWELFNINEFNDTLKHIKDGETRHVSMLVPDMETGNTPFKATMVVRNFTGFGETFNIKKLQNCTCKAVPVTISFTRRRKMFHCTHRRMSDLSIESNYIEPKETTILTLEVKYLLPDPTKMIYAITLSHARTIELSVNIRSLPRSVDPHLPSKYAVYYILDFKNVFIGEKEPLAKGFWLYNNTELGVKYKVSTNVLELEDSEDDANSIKCVNPSGVIASYWALPIIFKFCPTNTTRMEIPVPVHFDKELMIINIRANGSTFHEHLVKGSDHKNVFSSMISSAPVIISPQHVEIPYLTVWNFTEELVFVTNHTEDRTFRYCFQAAYVEGVVKAEACPMAGILHPKQCQGVVLKVTSFDLPCRMRLNVPCKLLDETQAAAHYASLEMYYTKQQATAPAEEDDPKTAEQEVTIVPQPEFVYQTISMKVKIFGVADRDLHLNVAQQNCLPPQVDVRLNTEDIYTCLFEGCSGDIYKRLHEKISVANIRFLEDTLYSLVRDTIHSAVFTNVVETMQQSDPSYYLQFKVNKRYDAAPDEDIRRRMTEDFLKRPKPLILAKVFQQLIFDSVNEIFKLEHVQAN